MTETSATGTVSVTAAGGQSWRWQLRDRNGKWIKMNTSVEWTERGQKHRGKVIGSSKEGQATVRDESGKEHHLPASSLSVASPPSGGGTRQVKAVRGKPSAKKRPLPPLSAKAKKNLRDVRDLIESDVKEEDRAEAVKAAEDVVTGHVAKGLVKRVKDTRAVKALQGLVKKGNDAAARLHILFLTTEKADSAVEKLTLVGEELLGAHTGQARGIGIGDFTTAIGLGNPFYDPVDFVSRIGHQVSPLLKLASQLIGSTDPEPEPELPEPWHLHRTEFGDWYVTLNRIPTGIVGDDRDTVLQAGRRLQQRLSADAASPSRFARLINAEYMAMIASAMED